MGAIVSGCGKDFDVTYFVDDLACVVRQFLSS